MKIILGLLSILAFAIPTHPAHAQTEASFPTAKWSGSDNVVLKAEVYKPSGAGPAPAVILLHGCGGIVDGDRGWAKRISSWGYVALLVDSYSPRGYPKGTCENTRLVSGSLRSGDVVGAKSWLDTQPYVLKDRASVIGWSHGGGTVMIGVNEQAHWYKYGIRSAVAFYPQCPTGSDNRPIMPTMILIGEKDDWVPARNCHAWESEAGRPDLVTAVYYSGAYHAFDQPLQKTLFMQGWMEGGVVKTYRLEADPDARKDAEKRVRAFFQRTIGP
jgi:dienelactone hydrolase